MEEKNIYDLGPLAATEPQAQTTTEVTPVAAVPAETQVAIEPPVAPQTIVPEPPSLEAMTGGKYKSLEDIDALAEKLAKIEAHDPFANEFAKVINDAFHSGKLKSIEDAARFVSVQFVDTERMSPKEAILTRLQVEKSWSLDKATEYFNDKFSAPDENDPDFLVKSKNHKWDLDEAVDSARAYINGLKVDPSTLKLKEQPAAPVAQPAQVDYKAQYEERASKLSPVVQKQVAELREHKLIVQKDGKDYYSLSVPTGVSPERAAAITQEITFDAISNGIDPTQGAAVISGMVRARIQQEDFDRILAATVLDVEAETTKRLLAENSNSKPPQQGSGQHTTKPVQTVKRVGPYLT